MIDGDLYQAGERYEKECTKILIELDEEMGRITQKKRDVVDWGYDSEDRDPDEHVHEWWDRIFGQVKNIFDAEMTLIGDLRELLARRKETKTLDRRDLEICRDVVKDMDEAAQISKTNVAVGWGRRPDYPDVKAKYRDLAYEHWDLARRLRAGIEEKDWPNDGVRDVRKCCASLDKPLETLAWLRGIFISYVREERSELDSLVEAIEHDLKEDYYISLWFDRQDKKGLAWSEAWKEKIAWEIENRDIAIVMVSRKYLSKSLKSEALKWELEVLRHRRLELGTPRICPVILGKCRWEDHEWLAVTQYWPPDGMTIREHYRAASKRQNLYVQMKNELVRVMKDVSSVGSRPGPRRVYDG